MTKTKSKPVVFDHMIFRHRALYISEQRGSVLIVSLILLLVISIVAVYSVRTAIHEEKMVSATRDRYWAFRSAESALNEAEEKINQGVFQGVFQLPSCNGAGGDGQCSQTACNNNGLCERPDPDCLPRWRDPQFDGWVKAKVGDDLSGTPQYFIELLDIYTARVTARSDPEKKKDGRAVVLLQSTYRMNKPFCRT